MPGVDYGVEQILPTGYMNHETTAGSVGGTVSADLDSITQVPLGDGVNATAYDFCDVLPASISGSVADCLADQPLSGVTVDLLNSTGKVLQTTTTNSSGDYQFTGLLPGVSYGVEQLLPAGYLNHDARGRQRRRRRGGRLRFDHANLADRRRRRHGLQLLRRAARQHQRQRRRLRGRTCRSPA